MGNAGILKTRNIVNMLRRLFFFVFLLTIEISYSQKTVILPEKNIDSLFLKKLPEKLKEFQLEDLETSKDSLNIRIWEQHTIFTLNYDSGDDVSANYKIYAGGKSPVVATNTIAITQSRKIFDEFKTISFEELSGDSFRGLDGFYIYIEIATKDDYKVISYWSPFHRYCKDCNTIRELHDILSENLDTDKLTSKFINSLEPGGYTWGMSSFQIDHFLNEDVDKTDFYIKAEKKIRDELNITEETNHQNFQLILINKKPAKIADLNSYTLEDIKSYAILGKGAIAFYGSSGQNGVLLVETN
ncbi:hypothetical protein DSM00_1088 [Leeuwenhoekiella aequorea]|uniref:Uncharacterized protein n=2 Tax=Leeuwenhoekiella aequorea TaxID=283736 RepID=A0A4Q0P9R9_9FLAO|nr:hypothetical protein DSM00_1088 [Leeuwenhoekiella aequorea]